MISLMVSRNIPSFHSFLFIFFVEMIAEIDTDSSGTVDFDGECRN